ncbi:hypothetical protein [Roseobacter sp. SK209-2-6]|uniref:hypothetical protein n=1 Tax=Roseobacter sp. SK209-2-6 TaxID=388739 RepID=UPI0018DBA908|nr:hypothetical protein [Roseobacter sp. SK209-2-6]
MIRRALAIAAMIMAAGYSQAQTIVARSGEHDGFSRLVFRLPDGAKWALNQTGRSASLRIDSPSVLFDTSRVFNKIPQDRLKALSQVAPGKPLQLQLGCDCEIKSYIQSNGYLVLDIRAGRGAPEAAHAGTLLGNTSFGAPLPGSSYSFNLSQGAIMDARLALNQRAQVAGNAASNLLEEDLQRRVEQITQEHAQGSLDEAPEPSTGTRLLVEGLSSELSHVPEGEAQPQLASTEDAEGQDTAPASDVPDVNLLLDLEESARTAAVNASEKRLLQQIGRATNQGLLDIALDDIPGLENERMLEPLGRSDRPLNALDNISVTSAIDREVGLVASSGNDDDQEDHCIADSELAVHSWGNEEPFADQISPLRIALVREFDDVNPATARRLAKLFLYFGFGAEAKATLAMVPENRLDPRRRRLQLAMAELLDGAELDINHPFSGQQSCDSEAAFWSALGDGVIKKRANTDAIQQTFARLPGHLRVALGPRVSTMFAEAGNHHVAEAILRAVTRTGAEPVPEINLAEAAIAELVGDTETVAEKLTDEVAERTESAPDALIELIKLSYRERKALSPDVPELAASYELESRDTELGARLRDAEVVSLALMGRFEQAFFELEEVTDHDGPAARARTMSPLMTLLTERADDVTFLKYGLVFAQLATVNEATPVADLMARRLLDLGFAEQAESILKKLALEPGNTERRLMTAEIALALDKPSNALVELMGLEGSKANKLRAEALWRNGEYSRASEYMLAEQDRNAAARGFWHSEDRDAMETIISTRGDEQLPFETVAGVTSEIEETSADPEGLEPLAHARALVESSIGTRDSIMDLLNRVGTVSETEN